ncbi:MAG: NUDIX domain-containing protein [Candidatus Omnitrophota bacterium]|nr:NUDIX domain-containing protein [Candidatus Omnitrophota bacterium]
MVRERSAGGVLIRRVGPRHEVCLILRELPRPRVGSHVVRRLWGLPKGHVEAGEQEAEAALREVEEETGFAAELLRPLGTIAYTFVRPPVTVSKTVAFFLMRALRRTGSHDATEIVEARWMPLGRAGARLAYENERRILRAAQQAAKKLLGDK